MNVAEKSDGFMKYARQPWKLARVVRSTTTTTVGERTRGRFLTWLIHRSQAVVETFYPENLFEGVGRTVHITTCMVMSFFDQPYYALAKTYMSRIGIWPEQSKCLRIILPLTTVAVALTLVGPAVALVRMRGAWGDINILARYITISLMGIGIFVIVLTCTQRVDDMRLAFNKIEKHWEMFKNTPAVIVLEKYAEQGRYITVVYSTCVYIAMTLYFGLCLSPVILDFTNPLNETRPKIYVIEAEYGVDAAKYYWFIMGHTYIVTGMAISMMVAVAAMYILWVVHSCALFEVVEFEIELLANKYTVTNENAITLRIDSNYKQICDCIILHSEAISFADMIEDLCSGSSGMAIVVIATITVISGVQALVNWKNPEVLIQQVTIIIGQVFHLYMISIPGQELMNRSGKIHTTAYNLEWQDMSANAQKLLIPILMRSNKPCYLTAGKVYVLSMETFGAAIRTVISYFTIFAQML